jgi:hypothetical protein
MLDVGVVAGIADYFFLELGEPELLTKQTPKPAQTKRACTPKNFHEA